MSSQSDVGSRTRFCLTASVYTNAFTVLCSIVVFGTFVTAVGFSVYYMENQPSFESSGESEVSLVIKAGLIWFVIYFVVACPFLYFTNNCPSCSHNWDGCGECDNCGPFGLLYI